MVKLWYQTKGNRLAILIEGEKEEIESRFPSFYNWNASFSELYETGIETRCYFWTSRQKLLDYYINIIEHKFFLKYGRELFDKAKELSIKQAKEQIKKIEYMQFLPRYSRVYLESY